MICGREFELSDCTEFRQTLVARPPRLLRATFLLLVGLVSSAVLWAMFTEADLVIRAPGRIRPMMASVQRPDEAAEESEVSPLRGGRVTEVHVREGDRVRKGDLLLRLDTGGLENDLAKQRQLIAAAEDELIKLDLLESALAQRFQIARAKAEAECAAVAQGIEAAGKRRDSAIRLAQVDLEVAEDDLQRLRKLAESQVATPAQIVSAESRARAAQLKLEETNLPVDESRKEIVQQALQLVERSHVVECSELAAQCEQKKGDVAATRLELAKLEWEQRQSELRASIDGTVTALDVKVGDVIDAGRIVLAVAEQQGFRIDVAVGSEDVGQLREGLPARIKLDAYDYQRYGTVTGRVEFISPDSAIRPHSEAQQPPAFTVRISLDGDQVGRGQQRGAIKLGMTGVAEIITDRESLLSLLVRSIRQSISLG